MNDENIHRNNPLHGVSLKNLLTEIVEHYGFKILYAYLNINCFRTNPSIDSSLKFLKKTEWARQKVEEFYLYKFKNLPAASGEQLELPPRSRIVQEGITPGKPAELSLEDAEQLSERRARKSAEWDERAKPRPGRSKSHAEQNDDREPSDTLSSSVESDLDPWAKWRKPE